MFEALFILTTVDAGTRVARFLLQEMGGRLYRPLGEIRWVPGTVVTSLVVVISWGYLIFNGSISTIWPMFGVSNQLLAAIALGVGTTLIIKSGKRQFAWVTFVPMVFMFITTFTAAWQLTFMFIEKAARANSADAFNFRLDAVLVVIMALLAVISLSDMAYKWYGYLVNSRDIKTGETTELASEGL
jgi:carbon starvation protein